MASAQSRPIVAVVVGGESDEYDISLASGSEVVAHLDPEKWDPFVVRIERDGAWCFPAALNVNGLAERLGVGAGIDALMDRRPALVFPVMHGPYGEDGRFQALMEMLHLPYVGSGVDASVIAMNKARAREVFMAAGLNVPPAEEIEAGSRPKMGPPCVVKPMRMGSSVGLSIAHSDIALAGALRDASEYDGRLLIEQFVAGRELTVGVLENAEGTPEALPIVEIRPKTADFFDYHAKYTPGATDEICPAPIDDSLRDEIQRIGLVAHRVLDCRGMSRTDVIVDDQDTVWVLEINTIPGLTQTSLLPLAAAEAGIDFPMLLDRLLIRAL
jgi:D-alanine-D-alanine ligase